MAPRRLPVAESEEVISLRQEVNRLQALATDTEDKLHAERELRVKSDIFCVQTSTELHQAQGQLDQPRTERQRLSERLAQVEATLESQYVVSDSLERRIVEANAEANTAHQQLATDHERLVASLGAHTAQLDRIRQYLADQDRGQSGVLPARIRALQDENNSLRQANSVLRRHSAMHEQDVDTLVLASAGISADEIDWSLLGLNPPDVVVGPPQNSGGSSSPDEPSTETSSVPAASRSPRPRLRLPRRSASAIRRLGRRPRVLRHPNCLRPSDSVSLPSTCVRKLRPPLPSVQAGLRVVTNPRSPLRESPTPSAALGPPGGESSESSDVPFIPVSSPSSARLPLRFLDTMGIKIYYCEVW
ncbi:hypothetical protein PR003_g28917 [Phytophthora rubi]|uniref:Uncharacterized protein n=1 Tax=Phytophthora rubi TaxID=129364 RepID=A0A6A3HG32_9STRA|nr:hypothetical protein PR002_g27801 [Phytophthora rubi]KAE8968969.1 hypothetical protein PR001_g27637 [Phytophthora rubi]KAE9276969.1 hypothetical protein PR003_g28917 [Phytophthora rubi]